MAVTDLPNGGKSYAFGLNATETDRYDADGNLTTFVRTDVDGTHHTEIDANHQVVQALGTDTVSDLADSTRFVFHPGAGAATTYGFEVAGPGHDALSLPEFRIGRARPDPRPHRRRRPR